MRIICCDENSPIRQKFFIALNYHHCDENQSVGCKLITVMKGFSLCHHCDELSLTILNNVLNFPMVGGVKLRIKTISAKLKLKLVVKGSPYSW